MQSDMIIKHEQVSVGANVKLIMFNMFINNLEPYAFQVMRGKSPWLDLANEQAQLPSIQTNIDTSIIL